MARADPARIARRVLDASAAEGLRARLPRRDARPSRPRAAGDRARHRPDRFTGRPYEPVVLAGLRALPGMAL
jgi:hypothetical protein